MKTHLIIALLKARQEKEFLPNLGETDNGAAVIPASYNLTRKAGIEMGQITKSSTGGLIPVFAGEIGGIQCNVCDARALHEFLGSKRQFSDWIKQRIEKYGFVENEEFSCFTNLFSGDNQGLSNLVAGGNRRDYHLTLDTAKEISMVENNEQGKQARRYFIACERKAQETAAGVKQPLLGKPMPDFVEKACDMTSMRLTSEHQHRIAMMIGAPESKEEDEAIWAVAFVIKKRLYARLAAIAKDLLGKNTPEDEVMSFIIDWKTPQA